jgi:predicted metal-dependent enzyme (double-stranded beta helix superfamily)
MMDRSTFEVGGLVEDLQTALREPQPTLAVRDVLDRVLADAPATEAVLARDEGGLEPLHVSDELTVLNVVWAPGMRLFPHDHRMWAAIGIYGGTEDNEFFRRDAHGLETSGGTRAEVGDVLLLGDDAIHAVSNPVNRLTGAIHVYGGDFFAAPRSEWDPVTLEERPWSVEHANAAFADANESWCTRPDSDRST